MGLLNNILSKFLPMRDEHMLELRREIETLKAENKQLREARIKVNQNNEIPIKFYDENIEEIIIDTIRRAKNEICIAMAYFTSDILIDELYRAKDKGVNIKVIIDNNDKNINSKLRIANVCSMFRIVKVITKYKNIMHNKYCIIDNKIVIDGSYNWSKTAKYNEEHIIIVEANEIAEIYMKNFNKIFNNSRYYANYDIYENVV
ncbi:phospholipase D-like domain-containing protein [Paraclostridium bifermentans]|uniref:phospholipase D-like domain-containing protein n=1 Tax=Paraclostridium bifermentans TaxID=1490 RepID=UPI00189C821E|nr:phospholipase D-like domain-containing protein [Paraclostridium bifermentans]